MDNQDEASVLEYVEQFSEVFNSMVQEVMKRGLETKAGSFSPMQDPEKISAMLSKSIQVDSAKLVQNQIDFMEQQSALWQNAAKAMFTQTKVDPVITEARSDRRFGASEWADNPMYSYLKQAYLLNSKMLTDMVETIEFDDPKEEQQAKFYTRQYISSVAPTNSLFTNPEVCQEILNTQGQSLVRGAKNFMQDLEQSPAEALKITQTDPHAFTLGEDLATTLGKVVYENDLMQLLHYTPAKNKKVYQRPVLITPPFINKYYILDLDQKKSLPRWLLEQGYSVFMISWVNPDAALADKDLGNYMLEGPIAALDQVQAITGADKVNMVGWCIGGTTLAGAAAYLKSKGDDRINSLTFLTSLLDFSMPGEVGNYLTEQMVPLVEQNADQKGILDGRILGMSFSLLRENNLFWSYFINNYLKGQDPTAFDILYWNGDSTNLPAAAFKQYVRNTYVDNLLREPGGMVVDGVALDLSKIDVPCYFLSTINDHIVPWQGSYLGTELVSGPTRFVLAGSGHLAGVINPVEGGKYPHWTNAELAADAEQWLAGATQHEGSWWPDWNTWMAPMSGAKVTSPKPGKCPTHPAIEDAPGRYVKVRI